jgi:tetratricopeptide (TPR) repeat protein
MNRLMILALLLSSAALSQTFEDLSARATAARELNNIPQAVELYRQALKVNAQWQEGWWFLGTLLYDGDQYAAGRAAFQHFVDLNATAAPGWAFLGLCEFETGEYSKSLADIQRALSLGADKEAQLAPVLIYHLALLETQKGDFEAALQTYAGIVRGTQNAMPNEPMLLSIGLAALRSPQLPTQVEPSQKDLFLCAGKAAYLVFASDYSQADATFADLLRRYPHSPNVHYMHAIYLMARDPEAAFQEFQRELEVAPRNTAADAMLAFGSLTRGDAAEALPYALKAAQSKDSNAFGQYLYGRALVETGEIQRGLTYLKQAEQADGENADVHVTLAAAYSRAGQPAQARRERQLAMQLQQGKQAVAQP